MASRRQEVSAILWHYKAKCRPGKPKIKELLAVLGKFGVEADKYGLAIVLLVFLGTWGLLKESLGLAIDSVPTNVDPQAVADFLRQLPGVTGLHDLHIWAMSTTDVALTVHLTMDDCPDSDAFLHGLSHELAERFGIRHPTVQIERDAPEHCPLASPESL